MVPARSVGAVLVVLVQPVGEGVSAFLLAGVAAGVGPPVTHRAVEPLHFSVGLRPVRAGELRTDRQRLAGVAPQVRPVCPTVVGQHSFDGHATFGEPLDRPVQDGDGGYGRLVVVDLGVRDAGVVVNDGVHERVPKLGVAVLVARLAWGDGAVPPALAATDVALAAAVGDVPELLHVHVNQRPGVGVLVPADGFTGGPVDVGQPVQAGRGEDAMHGGGCNVESGSELNGSFPHSHS